MNKEIVERKLSFYGRLADEITRDIIPPSALSISMPGVNAKPLFKPGGFFAFSGIPPSPLPYSFNLSARAYMPRTVTKNLPPGDAASLELEGEDELYIQITGVQDGEQKKVSFATLSFLKPIPADAPVFGLNGFSTTLAQSLEGEDIQFAFLQDVTGLNPGDILRLKRSPNLVMRPGPYYPFAKGVTQAVLSVRDASIPSLPPLGGAVCEINEINDTPVSSTGVGGVDIYAATIGQDTLILGPLANISVPSDSRGTCVFYYPPLSPVEKLNITVGTQGFDSQDVAINLITGERVNQTVLLNKS